MQYFNLCFSKTAGVQNMNCKMVVKFRSGNFENITQGYNSFTKDNNKKTFFNEKDKAKYFLIIQFCKEALQIQTRLPSTHLCGCTSVNRFSLL